MAGELSTQEIQRFNEEGLFVEQAFIADNGICALWTDITKDNRVFINFKYHKDVKFTPSVYKKMIVDFANVLDIFESKGVPALYTMVPGHEDPYTFGRMFGFEPIQTLQKDGNILYWVLERKLCVIQ